MNLSARKYPIDLLYTAYECILDLATEDGINASGKDEIYGCIFGRDSAITILKLLRFLKRNPEISGIEKEKLLEISKRGLTSLIGLQGRTFNIESGEEPGKFIHEYRKDRYEHLVQKQTPWFVYPDGKLRNYDSIDATPLALIAIHRYFELTQDAEFILKALPAVEKGLNWIISYGDVDRDFLIEYELKKERKYGGLRVQSWTDSHESMKQVDGSFPQYPIAPVEAQGYAWLALKLWSSFYKTTNYADQENIARFASSLETRAESLKNAFNELFFMNDHGYLFPVQALDGLKNQIKTVTGNPMLLLWATFTENGTLESIIETKLIEEVVARTFQDDLFDTEAGIRTMSTLSLTFDATSNSYHNGSFWPKLNGMAHEGLLYWGFEKEADALRQATLKPILHFGTPIELYVRTENGYSEWKDARTGQTGCRNQAWSAASILDMAA